MEHKSSAGISSPNFSVGDLVLDSRLKRSGMTESINRDASCKCEFHPEPVRRQVEGSKKRDCFVLAVIKKIEGKYSTGFQYRN